MNKVIYIIVLLLSINYLAYSEVNLDSIYNNISYNNPDSIKLRLLSKEFKKVRSPYYSLYFAIKFTELAESNNWKPEIAKGYFEIGRYNWLAGQYSKSLSNILNAMNKYKELRDTSNIGNCYNLLGIIYGETGDTVKSFKFFNRALNIFKLKKEMKQIAIIYENMASIHSNYGNIHQTNNFAENSIKLFSSLKDKKGIGDNILIQSSAFYRNSQLDSAFYYANKALKYFESYKGTEGIAVSNMELGKIELKRNNYKKAEFYLNKGLKYFEGSGWLYNKSEFLDLLIELYKNIGNYDKALHYQTKLLELKDTVRQNDIKLLEARFDLDRQIDKHNTEIVVLEKEKKIEKNRLTFIILSLLILIVASIIIVYILIVSNRTKKKFTEQLQHHIDTKNKFFSIISHDLKGPLSSFNQLTGLLLGNFDKLEIDEIKKHIASLENSSAHIHNLLDNLLIWARVQSNDIKPEKDNYSLLEIVNEVVSYFTQEINSKSIGVEIIINDNTVVYADEQMIKLVIRNLISNAIKFSHNNGIIEISENINNNYVDISLKDKGTGISLEDKQKLFKIDQRVSRAGTNYEKGTGLGLNLCKEFIELNNGQIWFDSEISDGSEFHITIPLTNDGEK
jgi:signal transduction histidine kinase